MALQSYADCAKCQSGDKGVSQCLYCRRYVCPEHALPRSHNCQGWEASHPSQAFARIEKVRTGNRTIRLAALSVVVLLAGMVFLIPPVTPAFPQASSVSGPLSAFSGALASGLANATQAVVNWFSPQHIDGRWMAQLVSVANSHRTTPLTECASLTAFAQQRFADSTSGGNWQVMDSNLPQDRQAFSGDGSQVQEAVFHPDGYTPSQYYSAFLARSQGASGAAYGGDSAIGYYIGTSPTVIADSACVTSGAPPVGADLRQFYSGFGCTTTVGDSTWVVVEVAPSCAP